MIQELQTGILDINNRYGIDFTCKQLDDVILKIIVYDKSLPADLSNYNCRLKAFKADQVPLIQNTNITIVNNVAEIKASKQLTTTLGIVKAELQFINKSTLEKKSTFYINIEVVASVLDVDGTVSTPTCTILEEIDHKLDQIENIGEVLDEAKEVRDTLTNTTIPGATSINSTLESNIKNASNKIVEVESSITNASKKIEEVEASTKNANSSKEELDLSKTNADTTKENLDTANVQAEKNIEELNKLGDVTELAKNVQTNTTDITNLKEDVENNTSYLKDVENDIKNLDDIKINKKVKYYTSEETTKGANPNNALEGCFVIAHELNPVQNGFCYYEQFFYGDISETANRIQYVTTYNGDLRRFIRRYFNGNWETKELATTETAEIGLLNGWEKDYGELKITKTGGVCYLNFQGTVGVSSVGTTIFNIPEGFRPKYQQVFYIPQRDGKPFFGVAIDTNGNVDISGVTSLPTQGAKTDFYMMWRVD
ncbi:pyocin knob domain-containing protein [Clostridium sp. M14]|uniref:pyocin knob domain-containing protein n=1 Tax=Clostridium sp. M14 TaxID=2716311 RepID=UPI001CCF2241|nr:pyocin knob domain-containing protein [Clostridium sp. M14]MBZ9690720.1 viral A-type inclusion protein [Clostridium sp. M14]